MLYFEKKLFKLIWFLFYARYVDGSFCLHDLSKHNDNAILNLFNTIDTCIQFTAKIETQNVELFWVSK